MDRVQRIYGLGFSSMSEGLGLVALWLEGRAIVHSSNLAGARRRQEFLSTENGHAAIMSEEQANAKSIAAETARDLRMLVAMTFAWLERTTILPLITVPF
jgi:hypothetical protein